MNCEVLYIQVGFRKGRGTRDQIVNIHWIIKKAREFQKYTYFCFIDHSKAFDSESQQTEKLTEIGIPDHLTCLLRNLYAGQETTVKTEHGKTDCFQIGKGVHKGCILLRESIPRQIDKKSRSPQGERGLEFSSRKKDKHLLSLYIP